MSDQAINNFCVPGGMHYFRGLTTGRCDCGVREAPVLVDRETYDALNAERDALMAERYKLASDIVAAQRREAEAYRLRAVAVEVADRLTAERDRLHERLDWQKHKRGQVEADRDALLAENERLREALIETFEYDDGTFMQTRRRCRVCSWSESYDFPVGHEAHCVLAAAQPPAAGTEGAEAGG